MAIQFPCGACGQPVEIDDEWGGKTVACPFCHSQIVSPTESQLQDSEEVPLATPLQRTPPSQPAPLPPGVPAAPTGTNRLAIVAVVLAGVMLVSLLGFNRVMAAHISEWQAMQARLTELMDQGKSIFVAAQSAQLEFLEKSGGSLPGWLVAAVILEFVGLFAWLGAAICGAIAVSRPQHRRYSIGALIACGVTPILLCCVGPGM